MRKVYAAIAYPLWRLALLACVLVCVVAMPTVIVFCSAAVALVLIACGLVALTCVLAIKCDIFADIATEGLGVLAGAKGLIKPEKAKDPTNES